MLSLQLPLPHAGTFYATAVDFEDEAKRRGHTLRFSIETDDGRRLFLNFLTVGQRLAQQRMQAREPHAHPAADRAPYPALGCYAWGPGRLGC